MQTDLKAAYPLLKIQLIGVNEYGQESANALMANGPPARNIPLLQDVDANANQQSDVWRESWNVVYRDVVILDGENAAVGVYNLTENNLADPARYSALREMLVDAAMTEQKPYQNPVNRYDVNGDGNAVPLDALNVINSLNRDGPRELAPPQGTTLSAPYYDADGNNFVTPIDVLQIVNYLNSPAGAGGEGESALTAPPPTDNPRWLPLAAPNAADTVLPPSADQVSVNVPAPSEDLEPVEPTGTVAAGSTTATRDALFLQLDRGLADETSDWLVQDLWPVFAPAM